MSKYTYQDVNPSLIDNTSMQIKLRDGKPYRYLITPVSGYALHDRSYDTIEIDEETGEERVTALGYRTSTATVPFSYDFSANMYEFYAVNRFSEGVGNV